MPASFLRKRVIDLLRPRDSSLSLSTAAVEEQVASHTEEEECGKSLFSHLFLDGLSGHSVHTPELYFGKTGCDLPLLQIGRLDERIVATCTGPDGGLTTVDGVREHKMATTVNLDDEMYLSTDGMDSDEEDSPSSHSRPLHSRTESSFSLGPQPLPSTSTKDGVSSWTVEDEDVAFGTSMSLYEKNPLTGVSAGSPIADVFAVCARSNNAVLALADGVNWGEGARLAARCAIRGAVDHLNTCIHTRPFANTNEVFHELLAAFHSAHALILQEGGMLTTLCVALALPVANSSSWVLCVCNVGDSLCFVYNPSYGVREVTLGSHDSTEMRDMRNAGGALGPVDGRNPQLHNLTCSETFVEPGDVVFITSDGISDNFDPVVGKFCVIKRTEEVENGAMPRMSDRKLSVCTTPSTSASAFHRTRTCAASIPCVDAVQRQNLMLLRMRDIIANGMRDDSVNGTNAPPRAVNPSRLCASLLHFALQLSAAKRRTLENPELYRKEKLSKSDERARRKEVRERIAELPGKLDHASVVAYRVGVYEEKSSAPTPPAVPSAPLKEEDLPEKNISCSISMENVRRQTRAVCSASVLERGGEREHVHALISPLPRATSPYEHIPVVRPGERRRHARGSTARHTLSVDVAWLKKLVTRKDSSTARVEGPSLGRRLRNILGSSKAIDDENEEDPRGSSARTRSSDKRRSVTHP